MILRRIDETETDPLYSPTQSSNGVPGIMQAIRAGNVSVLNPPGTGIVESSELKAKLPQICNSLTETSMMMTQSSQNSGMTQSMGTHMMMQSADSSETTYSTSPAFIDGKLTPVRHTMR